MATTEFIAAIELGSSKIAGMVGKKDSDGNLVVLAYATESSSSFIRKGVIFNMDKAVSGVTSIINKLEETVGNTISKIYVGIGGQSFRSLKNVVSRDLKESIGITEDIVNSICDENREMKLADLDILDVVPHEYHIGSMQQIDPVGVLGNHIEGHFLNIVARSVIKKNLERCFADANIEIADDPFIAPLVTAEAVLSESERRLGCALVDFGAGVTTVSVYRKNLLRFLSVIPLGGSNITHDLSSLNIEEDEAEELKIHYGNALFENVSDEGEEEIIHLREDDRTLELSKINDIVEARSEEIMANVWNQILCSGYEGRLGAGLVFTGGGSNLRNLNEAFCKYTKHQNLKIRTALTVYDQPITGVVIPTDGSQNTLLGMLLKGKENCCEQLIETPYVAPQFESQSQYQPESEPETYSYKQKPKSFFWGSNEHKEEEESSEESDLIKAQNKERIKIQKEQEKKKKEEKKKEAEKREEEKKRKANELNQEPKKPGIKDIIHSFSKSLFRDEDMDDDDQKSSKN